MVSHCANPKCAKPLHYLREGRIFAFDVTDRVAGPNGKRSRRMEHFWLCGVCSQTMAVEQSAEGIRVVLRPQARLRSEMIMRGPAIAS